MASMTAYLWTRIYFGQICYVWGIPALNRNPTVLLLCHCNRHKYIFTKSVNSYNFYLIFLIISLWLSYMTILIRIKTICLSLLFLVTRLQIRRGDQAERVLIALKGYFSFSPIMAIFRLFNWYFGIFRFYITFFIYFAFP